MDEKLIKKAIRGDKNAFAKIYREFVDDIWRYVFSRLKDKDLASDIVSESFISLFENIQNLKHPKALKSYLYKIAKSKMIAFYKREKVVTGFDFDRVVVEETSHNPKKNDKIELEVEKILHNLPEKYQDVLRLRFLSGLTIKEVANILDTTEGNIKVIQNRALKKARSLSHIKM